MMAVQNRKNKRGLQQLSDVQKMEAITKVQKGETKAAVAREFGVPESTLRGWCKKAKSNGHCHINMSKSMQVTATMMSPPIILATGDMAYRDCSYSKGSGSDEGSTTHPFSDEQEDDENEQRVSKSSTIIPEEQRRVLDWLNYGHYPQLTAQTPVQTYENKPAQPVVTSSTCDNINIIKTVSKDFKIDRKNRTVTPNDKRFGFYNWCKSNTIVGDCSSPVSPASSDKNDSYDDEPLALIVPSKRRLSDLESALKNQLNKIYQEQENNKQTLSIEEALQHGEVFLDWLKASSDPNVTVFQAMQIGTLIKNLRSSLERNQSRR